MGDDAEEILLHPMDHVDGLEELASRLQLYSSQSETQESESGIELILINSGSTIQDIGYVPIVVAWNLNKNPFYNGPDNDGHHRPYAADWRPSDDLSDEQKDE